MSIILSKTRNVNLPKTTFRNSFRWIAIIKTILITLLVSTNIKAQELNVKYQIGGREIHSMSPAVLDTLFEEVIGRLVLDEINSVLESRGLYPKTEVELLKKAAVDQAVYMAQINDNAVERNEKENKFTEDRIATYGGSKHGRELTGKTLIAKGTTNYSYAKIADDIVFGWFSSSKTKALIEDLAYPIVGVGAKTDADAKRVYVSLVLGNYKSFNQGAALAHQLPVPFSTKTFGLKEPENGNCKKIQRMDNLSEFQKKLSVENGIIYLETDDERTLQKLLNEKKDGLAIDIIQKEQFPCNKPNIIDHNNLNQGVLTKRIYSKKLFKTNLAIDDENKFAFKTPLGNLPENLNDTYELGLVVIKNKNYCTTLFPTFIIEPQGRFTKNLALLADTITINSRFAYQPVADTLKRSFKIPFENKKYTYNSEDIEPFLKLLNEPKFTILNLKITAYSSVEGGEKENRMLQIRRAESIVTALEESQDKPIKAEIITGYNLSDFINDIDSSEYQHLANKSLTEIQQYIKEKQLNDALEPYLQNHRYALIELQIAHNIRGENEWPFVLHNFNKAIKEEDRALALSIQKFIIKQVLSRRYEPKVLSELLIPETEDYAGMKMNHVWLQYTTQQISKEAFQMQVKQLYELDPDNEYIAFNDIYLDITQKPVSNLGEASLLQTRIDRLYYTPLTKKTVDGLNLKHQFRIINYIDSVGESKSMRAKAIEKIKEITDMQSEGMENSMKFAELYIENQDIESALKTLEPWVSHPKATENLVYAFLSLCSQKLETMHTPQFNYAMRKAQHLNPERFCSLFDGKHFTLLVLENEGVKQLYCKSCKANP
ncbi:MAG: CAP domain-containing protein [Salinivirgaceae bacterium]